MWGNYGNFQKKYRKRLRNSPLFKNYFINLVDSLKSNDVGKTIDSI